MQVLDGQIPKLTILPYFDYLCVHPSITTAFSH